MTTGVKSRNGTIGVNARVVEDDCTAGLGNQVTTIAELAEMAGMATGAVTTTRVTHATPAATFAHTANRDWESDADMPDAAIAAGCIDLARQLGVVIPLSFFERAGTAHFNSVAVIDADGAVLGTYRKSHIPQGPGYEEKFYFSPGDTGYRVWDTAMGRIGVGICWDQWFPEAARAMALQGAELLLYPTAIGSEPPAPGYDSAPHWEMVMRGHAAANILPVVASNRIGTETAPESLGLIRIDGGDHRFVAHHYSVKPSGGGDFAYYSQPRSIISLSGKLAMFTSNMNNQTRTDVFVVELPEA
jgi:predicted amidohydrolase